MSIYGFLPEENDDSADWLEDFKISPSAILLNDAFDELLSSDSKYTEVTECAHAYLAAALTYEIFSGKFRIILNFHSEQVEFFMQSIYRLASSAKINMIHRAIECLRIVVGAQQSSELFELMQEDDILFNQWQQEIEALNTGLKLLIDKTN